MTEAPWQVVVAPPATKALRRLDRVQRERITRAILLLPDGDTLQLKGQPGDWRLRVGEWRVRFRLDRQARRIDVLAVLPRSSAYKP